MKYKTEQEEFWAGDFGSKYSARNDGHNRPASNLSLFTKIFSNTGQIDSLIEFGPNRGLNLRAIKTLFPDINLTAVEINQHAKEMLDEWGHCKEVLHQSALEFKAVQTYDMSMVKGVLIHINPDLLPIMYDTLYNSSHQYILLAEYYNKTPVEVDYRGHSKRLFKRDFAGELLDRFTDLKLVDYGFVWHRDPVFPLDDSTWFLMEKR